MLQMDSDKVCWVVMKARAYDATEPPAVEDEGGNEIDDDFREVLEDQPDDPTREELAAFIEAMNEDEQAELVALAWLGRGDYTADEWSDAVAAARERHSGPTSEYLLGIPVLPDYLEEGLAAFGLSCTDFEADHL
ncbi:hypothetical protein ABIE65_001480 [Constrictibacter sp. MBR-5]|jgi:hypothetical protein|uniref:DUF3775 domain-containing protein n=1 Tax=Constrictibacter sp. MBR-5 TaxID=3156467 RepID=UPI00339828ED